jgi:hypothetical protein
MTMKPPHLCPHCHAVFATSLLLAEHRVGQARRCLSAEELAERGMRVDRTGVWRRVHR